MQGYLEIVRIVNRWGITMRATRLPNLQLLVYGILQSRSGSLSAIVRHWPFGTRRHTHRLKRLHRFLKNPAGYQVVAKGMSNRRAGALARQMRRWDAYQDAWLGEVEPPADYGRPMRVFVKRRLKENDFCHSHYLSTLSLPSKGLFMACYDARGGAGDEQFRGDKNGLSLEARRKRSFLGQKGYILLTDLAHNLLGDFHAKALVGSHFEGYGLKRIVRDLLNFPGRLIFENGKLVRVELLSLKQFARELSVCVVRYCSGF